MHVHCTRCIVQRRLGMTITNVTMVSWIWRGHQTYEKHIWKYAQASRLRIYLGPSAARRALQGPSQRWDNKNVGLSFRDYRVREILKLRLPAASRLQEAASGWNTDCALDQEAAASRWGRFYAQALDSLRVKSARPGSCRVPTKIILAASLR